MAARGIFMNNKFQLNTQSLVKIVNTAIANKKIDDVLILFNDMQSIDIAEVLEQLTASQTWLILQNLPNRADIFSHFDAEEQISLANQAPRGGLAPIVGGMAADERADLFKRLDKDQQAAILPSLAQAERDDIRRLASYEEGTAGAIMTSAYAVLRPDITAAQALTTLRLEAPDAETIYHSFVVDEKRRIVGAISLRELILADPNKLISDLMVRNVIKADVNTDQEEIAHLFARYDLMTLPITDADEQMVGIITYDDAMDAASDEATEDFQKGAAVSSITGNLKDAKVSILYKKRVFWLVFLVFGNLLSGMGIAHFEDIIAANLVLVFFLPLLVDSGGNAGSQSSTLMVRALATGDVVMKDWFKLLGKEFSVALLLGLSMAVAVSLIGYYRGGSDVAAVVAISMVGIVLIGCLIGMSLPFILSRLGFDPASSSAPLITSICDASGVVIYLFIASYVLGVAM